MGPGDLPRSLLAAGDLSMKYAIDQRMHLIDFLLAHYGTINRAALEDFFGISTPQASLDLKEYMRRAPGNLEYDRSAKTYRRAPGFRRLDF